jgi:hypothetical protein
LRLVEKARKAFLDFEVLVTMIETHSAQMPLKLSILRDDNSLIAAANCCSRRGRLQNLLRETKITS